MAESREKKKLCLVKDKLFSWHFFPPPLSLNFNQLLGGGGRRRGSLGQYATIKMNACKDGFVQHALCFPEC